MTFKVRVMLVDDHAIVREGYRRLLEAEVGISVIGEYGDAEAAYAAMLGLDDAALPDVLVLDLSMPGRGGLDMARRVAMRWPRVKQLVFTMHDHPATVAQALAAGAAGYITKTTEPGRLVDAVRRVAQGEVQVLSDDVARASASPAAMAPHEALTPREFNVFQLLVQGHAVDEIAARLSLSPKTVSNVQTAIRAKLGVGTAIDLLRYAQQHRMA